MAEAAGQPLNPRIQALLESLRRRIRFYIWAEGIALGFTWLALTFWFGFAIDYLPVLAGANELSAPIRGGLLLIVACMLGWILYRWIFRRTFVRLSDRNMAIIIERHFDQFGDRLVTAVELGHTGDDEHGLHDDMLQHAGDEALDQLDSVKLNQVFNRKSLLRSFLIAIALLSPAVVMSVTHGEMVSLLMRRIYLLADERWPRQADVQVVGVEVSRAAPLPGSLSVSSVMSFDKNRTIRIGRGTDLRLIVHADKNKRIPKTCTVYYQTSDDVSGRRNMQRQGSGNQDFQLFVFEEKPLKGILNSLEFEIVGFDDRDGPYTIEVVDNPAVVDTTLSYRRPAYTGLPNVQGQPWIKGSSVPFGTNLTVQFQSNKPLREAHVVNLLTDDQSMIFYGQVVPTGSQDPIAVSIRVPTSDDEPARRPASTQLQLAARGMQSPALLEMVDGELHFAAEQKADLQPVKWPLEARYQNDEEEWVDCVVSQVDKTGQDFSLHVDQMFNELSLDVSLVDQDGLPSEQPHRVTIGASLDQDPTVDVSLKGIGTAVTPDVVIPVEGKVSDDYGVDRNWFDLLLDEQDPFKFPFQLVDGEKIDSRLDLREQRNKNIELELAPGDRVTLTVRASDFFDLDGSPNVGSSSQYTLDVVTPNELLSVLERRELALRQRFELIFDEMIALRDSLDQVARNANGQVDNEAGREPEDRDSGDSDTPLTPEEVEQRARTLRLLRVQRAQVQGRKSGQETLGVALAFEDIRAELINNRVDTEQRKNRLQEEISQPLQDIANVGFPEFSDTLTELESTIVQQGTEGPLATKALEQTDQLLAQMQLVLDKMLELETYNELIDLVRALIAEQESVNEKTQKEQKKRALDLLR